MHKYIKTALKLNCRKIYFFSGLSKYCGFYAILFLWFFLFIPGFSQTKTIVIKDSETHTLIPLAGIEFISPSNSNPIKKTGTIDGKFSLSDRKEYLVTIAAFGYKTFSDTISGSDSVIFLVPESTTLEQVIITGYAKPKTVDKSIYKINLLDRREIELKAANSLGDIIKSETGFQYRSEGILGDFMRIQGLTGEHIKILIDGVPVTGRVGGVIDLNQLNLNNIDHIEIVEGPMSVVYGSNAMAGVINLISKKVCQKSISANIEGYYETIGKYNFNVNLAKRFGKQTFSGYFARNFNYGWSPDSIVRYDFYKPKLQYLGGITWGYSTDELTINLQSDLLYEELRDLDSGRLSVKYDEKADSTYGIYLATDYYHYTTRINNRANLNYSISNKTFINVLAGYSYYKKRKETFYKNLVDLNKTIATNPELFDTTKYHLITNRIILQNQSLSNFEILAGTEFNREQSNSSRTGGNKEITEVAAFAQVIYSPFNYISLQPGFRFIYNSCFKAPVVYSLNLLLNPGHFQLRASYGKAFRAPSLKELYMEFVDNNHHVFGNPDLRAETGNSINLSLSYLLKPGYASIKPEVMAFYNTINNAIQLAIDPNRPGGWGYYFNISESDYITKGYRINLKTTFKNFSLLTGLATTGKSTLSGSKKFQYSTDYICNAGFSSSKLALTINLNYKYTGNYFDYAGTFDNSFTLTGIQEQQFSDYQLMDLVINKTFADRRILISTGIKNIFDVSLIDTKGTLNVHGGSENSAMAGYGRSYFLKLIYRFEKNNE